MTQTRRQQGASEGGGMMKLWLVKRPQMPSNAWDEYIGFVVRAETESDAREYAAIAQYSWKPDGRWLDPAFAICSEVAADGDAGVVLDSFNAG